MTALCRQGIAALLPILLFVSGCGPGTAALLAAAVGLQGQDSDGSKTFGRPAGVSARSEASWQVTVEWSDVPGASTYHIYWDTNPGVTKASGTQEADVSSPFLHVVPSNGTTYYYVVTAARGARESSESQEVLATPVDLPSGVSARSDASSEVRITWNPVVGAASYNLYMRTAPGVTKWNGTLVSGIVSPHVQSMPSNGVPYYFVVTAANAYGGGAESTESSEVTVTPLDPPWGVSANAGPSAVTLQWNAVSGATGYNIYWSDTPGVTKLTGTVIPGVTSPHVHSGLAGGTTYYYVVTGENATAESSESAEVSATPTAPPLPPPGGVQATPGDSEVTITWNPVGGADSYNIYWDIFPNVTKTTGTLVLGATSPYDHTGLTNGTTYYYVVTTYSISRGESMESVEVNATPVAAQSILYGAARSGYTLVTIDTSTGLDYGIGDFIFDVSGGLAYDRNTDTLYALAGGSLAIINQATGAATPIGSVGFGGPDGMAFDPNTDTLYGANSADDELVIINRGGGPPTVVGPLVFRPGGLAFDPNTDTLYGISSVTAQELYEIDTAAGGGILIGPIGFALSMDSIAFDPTTDTLYGASRTTDTLYTIDTATAAITPVGSLGSIRLPDIYGLAFKY